MKVKFNLKADTPNINGTVYPKKELKRAIKEFKKRIKEGNIFGTLKQPIQPNFSLVDVAFNLIKLTEEDENFVGDIIILSTPQGKILKEILDDPERFRIVTLSHGEITKDKDGNNIVNNLEIEAVGIEPKDNCA